MYAGVLFPAVLVCVGVAAAFQGTDAVDGAALDAVALKEPLIEGDQFPRRLTDPTGYVQTIDRPPQRIVSVTLVSDEILTRIVEPERLVGVSYYATDPDYSNCVDAVPEHAAHVRSNTERLLQLEPDMIFVSWYSRAESVRLLMAAGIPVVRFGQYGSFDNIIGNIRLAGRAVGEEARSEALVNELQAKIAAVERRVAGLPRPRVLYFSPPGYTAGRGTTIDELIAAAGGVNVAREAGFEGPSQLSMEFAIGLQPDIVIVSEEQVDRQGDFARRILADELWRDVPAVRTGRVYSMDSAHLLTVSHYITIALNEMAELIHPEAFTA